MAGDWLKMEASTPEKGEVLAITALMGWDDPDLTVGKLFRLWRWFDQHTLDGNAPRVTPALLDRHLGVTGFCEAVQEAGWLVIDGQGVSLPKFDRHNGNSAKNRALTAKRVAKHKSGNAEANAEGNGENVSGALPREEKIRGREEKRSNTPPAPQGGMPEGFAEFWLAWPPSERKQDKAKCLAQWKAKGLEQIAERIVADVRVKRGTRKWAEGYQEAPLTYLRGQRWEDGVIPQALIPQVVGKQSAIEAANAATAQRVLDEMEAGGHE